MVPCLLEHYEVYQLLFLLLWQEAIQKQIKGGEVGLACGSEDTVHHVGETWRSVATQPAHILWIRKQETRSELRHGYNPQDLPSSDSLPLRSPTS